MSADSTTIGREGNSWVAVFLGEFSDPFLRLLLFAALLSGIVGMSRGDLSEATGIVMTTALTALAATFNRLRTNREFTAGLRFGASGATPTEAEAFRVREFIRRARGGLIGRLERLVAIIGVIAAGVALFTLGFLVTQTVRVGHPSLPLHEWAFAGIVLVSAVLFTARLWLYLLYQVAAVVGAEVTPNDVFEHPDLLSWKFDAGLGFMGFSLLLILGLVAGLIPADPRAWLSWPMFLELQRMLIVTISIIVITVPDGLGMSVALALRLGISKIHALDVRVRDPHLCEWFGTITLFLIDQDILRLLPAAEFERLRRRMRGTGIEMRPVFTADRSLDLIAESVAGSGKPSRRLVHPTLGPGGTRLELPYLPELDGFVVDRIESDLLPLVTELELRGETVAWIRPLPGQPEMIELTAVSCDPAGPVLCREPMSLARFPASGLGCLPGLVEQGRVIGDAIRRFLVFQLPVNLAGMLFEIAGLLMGWHLPLSLPQVLWINLVMDVFAPWVLAGEPVGTRTGGGAIRAISTLPNRSRSSGGTDRMLVNAGMFEEILWVGLTMFLIAMGFLATSGGSGAAFPPETGATFFGLFLMMQWWNLFLARFFGSDGSLLAQPSPGTRFCWSLLLLLLSIVLVVQFGGTLLQSSPVSLTTWAAMFLFPSIIVAMGELRRRGVLPGA